MSVSSMTVGGKVKYKLVLLGDQHVGKSSIIDRFIHDKFEESYNATIGIDFLVRNIVHDNKTYRLQLWDTAGQERFRALIPSYLKDSHCGLIVYDIADPKTLDHVSGWLDFYTDHKEPYSAVVLVGNKLDRGKEQQSVKAKQLEDKIKHLKIPSFQISAKTGEGVTELFQNIIDIIGSSLKNQTCSLIEERPEEDQAGTASVVLSGGKGVKLNEEPKEVHQMNSPCC